MAIPVRAKRFRYLARLRYDLLVIVIAASAIIAAWISTQYHWNFDLSASARHSLSSTSQSLLDKLEHPLRASAYVPDHPAVREKIRQLLRRYQRYRPDFTLDFVDPTEAPERMKTVGVRLGEIVIYYGGRDERIHEYTEQALSDALARLLRQGDSWLVFTSGHGERSPGRSANHDISTWATTLENRGLKVQTLSLVDHPIPSNTSVLVIASPQLTFLTGEVTAIGVYLAAGGNLLWFAEPGLDDGLNALDKALGLIRLPGTIIDPVTQAMGIDNPAIAIVNRYAEHAATQGFDALTVFPYATALLAKENHGWRTNELFSSGDKSWSEQSPLIDDVAFDDSEDIRGPFTLAIAFERDLANKQQRVIVVGDGDFLTNSYLGNGGNLDLGVRLIEWLTHDDKLVEIAARTAPDTELVMKTWHIAVMGFGFLFFLPGALALNGVLIAWRRRA